MNTHEYHLLPEDLKAWLQKTGCELRKQGTKWFWVWFPGQQTDHNEHVAGYSTDPTRAVQHAMKYFHSRVKNDGIEVLRHAARVIELYDDTTMQANHMLSSTDCAGIMEALVDFYQRYQLRPLA